MKLLDNQQIKILLHVSSLFTFRSQDKTNAVATILDKTTWENVAINVHYLTQQNYFQINGFA